MAQLGCVPMYANISNTSADRLLSAQKIRGSSASTIIELALEALFQGRTEEEVSILVMEAKTHYRS